VTATDKQPQLVTVIEVQTNVETVYETF